MISQTAERPKLRRKPQSISAETLSERQEIEQLAAEDHLKADHVELIALGNLVRHPLNRHVDPNDPDVIALAHSMSEHGQLEPLRVRRISSDKGQAKYQIISGERRYTALLAMGTFAARCIVVDADDGKALAEVAVANSHRKDLDPIERAELMQLLMKPVADGGSGYSLEQAGHVFGLTSESGCKNALRMLRLPESIRKLVRDGTLPERIARSLVPYTVAPSVMKEIEEQFTSRHYDTSETIAEVWTDPQAYFITSAIDDNTRPISPDVKRRFEYPLGEHACLFDWEQHAEQLQIVDLPYRMGWGQNGKIEQRKFALNVKLWDKLQLPLVKQLHEDSKSKGSKGTKSQAGNKTKATATAKLSPAQLKAEAKRKAAEADKRLKTFTADWSHRFLRCAIAGRSSKDELVAATIAWLTSAVDAQWRLRALAEATLIECQHTAAKGHNVIDQLSVVSKMKRQRGDEAFDLMNTYWRLILWPVSKLINDKAKPHHAVVPAGKLPDRIPGLCAGAVEQLAEIAGVSIETAWNAGATDGTDERRLISVWLCRQGSTARTA